MTATRHLQPKVVSKYPINGFSIRPSAKLAIFCRHAFSATESRPPWVNVQITFIPDDSRARLAFRTSDEETIGEIVYGRSIVGVPSVHDLSGITAVITESGPCCYTQVPTSAFKYQFRRKPHAIAPFLLCKQFLQTTTFSGKKDVCNDESPDD